METTQPKKSKDPLYITLIVLLLGAGSFLFYQMQQYRSGLETCVQNADVMQKEISDLNLMLKNNGMVDLLGDNLRDNLDQLLSEYQGIQTNNKSMRDSINKQIHAIDSLSRLAEQHKGDAYMIYKLNKETETLRKIMQGYVHTIDSLNTLNQELHATIQVKDRQISDVSQERDEIKDKNKQLEDKVARGSALQTSGLTAGAIHLRNSGRQVETSRSGRADMIKACFTIMENPIAKTGLRQIYMVVITPDATVLSTDPNAKFKWEGGESQYSLVREIDYQNELTELCMYADVKQDLVKGVYIVELYSDGSKIGKTSFTLK